MTQQPKRIRSKPFIAMLAIAVVGAAALVWSLLPSPERVVLTEVQQGHFAEYARDEGRTFLENTYNVAVPIHGYLRRVALNAGDEVAAGDALFHVEPLPTPALDVRSRQQAQEALSGARARVDAAGAELDNRRAEYDYLSNELQRYRQLAVDGAVSTIEVERIANQVERAQAAMRAARASQGAAQAELENARLVLAIAEGTRSAEDADALAVPAPISGVVLRRFRCCEGVVNAGDVVMELGNLAELEVRVDLLSQQAVRVRPGMRAVIERWGGDTPIQAQVRAVDPAGFTKVSALGIDEQRVAVYLSLDAEPEQIASLGEGYRVEASIVVWESDDAVYVPVSALLRRDDAWHVFVYTQGRAQLQPVELGRRSGIYTQITSGLEVNTQVVNHPPAHLRNGQAIAPL